MKPTLFIGSSIEGIKIAYAVQEELELDAEVTVWSQGVFFPTRNTLDDLIASLGRFDFALFVFSPDDKVRLRGEGFLAVRDNILFELGLFIGRIGRERTFFLVPRDGPKLRIPTDLLGITPLLFDALRSDGNLRAAVGPPCNTIRGMLSKHEQIPRGPIGATPTPAATLPTQMLIDNQQVEIEKVVDSIRKAAKREKAISIILFADIDGFTGINKWFGKQVCDEVIAVVEKIVTKLCDKHYSTRIGGDQFLVCMKAIPLSESERMAKKLVENVSQYHWASIVPNLYVNISVGLAPSTYFETVQEWIIRAINGSILAKKSGGSRVVMAPITLSRNVSRVIRDWIS